PKIDIRNSSSRQDSTVERDEAQPLRNSGLEFCVAADLARCKRGAAARLTKSFPIGAADVGARYPAAHLPS
ncbi:MAG: hypothetical protein AAF320_03530, partial [Myxococcota bacterium]